MSRIRSGDPAAKGRLLTRIVRGDPAALALVDTLVEKGAPRRRAGFTGPPGVGKSSLLSAVAREVCRRGQTAALLLADPVSPRTGGAFLGDRVRFAELAHDDRIFIRSLAHRAGPGQPTDGGDACALVLEAAGYDWVFFETVGVGQTETAVLGPVDARVLVLSPDSGDWHQMLKAGYLETAEFVVVNKSDRPGASSWARELEGILAAPEEGEHPPRVVLTSARTGSGVAELVDLLDETISSRRSPR